MPGDAPLALVAATLATMNAATACVCGKAKGHAGWLLCALTEAQSAPAPVLGDGQDDRPRRINFNGETYLWEPLTPPRHDDPEVVPKDYVATALVSGVEVAAKVRDANQAERARLAGEVERLDVARNWLWTLVYEFVLVGPRRRTALNEVETQRFLARGDLAPASDENGEKA